MYIHLGQNVIVNEKDITGIFDLDNTTIEKSTREYIYNAEKENRVETITGDLPKSFVTMSNGKVYISPISSKTLQKRRKSLNVFFRRSCFEK